MKLKQLKERVDALVTRLGDDADVLASARNWGSPVDIEYVEVQHLDKLRVLHHPEDVENTDGVREVAVVTLLM